MRIFSSLPLQKPVKERRKDCAMGCEMAPIYAGLVRNERTCAS